ncbi:hypothetical protein GQ53DRAFT_333972 [Thozetella sp. PMI_491]|nr:hypothetical protein GQ53DRAFT_333972 [Thozetella sp. PMI_491]
MPPSFFPFFFLGRRAQPSWHSLGHRGQAPAPMTADALPSTPDRVLQLAPSGECTANAMISRAAPAALSLPTPPPTRTAVRPCSQTSSLWPAWALSTLTDLAQIPFSPLFEHTRGPSSSLWPMLIHAREAGRSILQPEVAPGCCNHFIFISSSQHTVRPCTSPQSCTPFGRLLHCHPPSVPHQGVCEGQKLKRRRRSRTNFSPCLTHIWSRALTAEAETSVQHTRHGSVGRHGGRL